MPPGGVGHGRLPVQANADRAYAGILDLADLIDRYHLADETGVFRRGEAAPRYHNALNHDGQWTAAPALRAAVEAERARTWTAAETTDFQITQARLHRELRPEWTRRFNEISSQAQPLINPLQRARPGRELTEQHRTWNKHTAREPDLEPEAGA